jgi:hypothetical protein
MVWRETSRRQRCGEREAGNGDGLRPDGALCAWLARGLSWSSMALFGVQGSPTYLRTSAGPCPLASSFFLQPRYAWSDSLHGPLFSKVEPCTTTANWRCCAVNARHSPSADIRLRSPPRRGQVPAGHSPAAGISAGPQRQLESGFAAGAPSAGARTEAALVTQGR